jgi:hypothetical protein
MLGAGLLVLTAGCSGINSSHSVSPASFFLPGFLKAEPPPAAQDAPLPEVMTSKQVALAR